MKFFGRLLAIFAVLILATAALVTALGWRLTKAWNPDPVTVAAASLQAVREQAVLTPFAARFVAVVTSEQHRLGFAAKETLIMPGLVRYEVDLAALQQRDLAWNAASHTLTVTLPPIRLSAPEIDPNQIQRYSEGKILLTLTDAETVLDAANRTAGQAEIVRQARDALPMRLARNAARNVIERSFAMPLRAAGIEARVTARFAGE